MYLGPGRCRGLDPDADADHELCKHLVSSLKACGSSHPDFASEIVFGGPFHRLDDSDHIRLHPFDFALMRSKSCLLVMVSECPGAEPSAEAVNG
jgi:hypothetical protein